VKHIGALTTAKVPEHRDWLRRNEQIFREKWGWVPAGHPAVPAGARK
jgi:hypothetical protein